jgi:sporulation protein YlmC with PRC-barrel domain
VVIFAVLFDNTGVFVGGVKQTEFPTKESTIPAKLLGSLSSLPIFSLKRHGRVITSLHRVMKRILR